MKLLKRVATFFAVVIMIGLVVTILSPAEEAKPISPTPTANIDVTTPNTTPAKTPAVKKWSDGTYMVGKDLPPGLYRVTLSTGILTLGLGYVERSRDISMSFQDIIANETFTGNGYVEILPTDKAVKVTGCYLTELDLDGLEPDLMTEIEAGIYLVGFDIAPGTYAVSIKDNIMNMGYVARLSGLSMGFSDLIANELFQGPGYVRILPDDIAVQISGAKLTFVE